MHTGANAVVSGHLSAEPPRKQGEKQERLCFGTGMGGLGLCRKGHKPSGCEEGEKPPPPRRPNLRGLRPACPDWTYVQPEAANNALPIPAGAQPPLHLPFVTTFAYANAAPNPSGRQTSVMPIYMRKVKSRAEILEREEDTGCGFLRR